MTFESVLIQHAHIKSMMCWLIGLYILFILESLMSKRQKKIWVFLGILIFLVLWSILSLTNYRIY